MRYLAATSLLALGPGLASAQPADGPADLVLVGDRIFDGVDRVVEESGAAAEPGAAVAVRQGLVAWVGRVGDLPSEHAELPRVDLAGHSLLPGYIDTHVHLAWSFDLSGRTMTGDSPDTPEQRMLLAAENAARTLRGGVTTVQSIGRPEDLVLRDMIARGVLQGPRVLTSAGAISNPELTPEQLRRSVRDFADRGADVIKVFASASIRVGGTPTLSQEQLDAICGEARSLGLRSAVHAHSVESARRAVAAGCTTIEHGALLDRPTLELMAREGVYYDPNIDLVLRNYFENEERFLGVGNYTANGFEQMREAGPQVLAVFRIALEVDGLDIVFGTDALAGAHGRNVEELIYRIREGGQEVLSAIRSATSLAAESLGLGEVIGTVRPGFEADLIAVAGDPRRDVAALADVRWVMKAGRVYIGELAK